MELFGKRDIIFWILFLLGSIFIAYNSWIKPQLAKEAEIRYYIDDMQHFG